MPRRSRHLSRGGSSYGLAGGTLDLLNIANFLQIPPEFPGEKHIRGLNFAGQPWALT